MTIHLPPGAGGAMGWAVDAAAEPDPFPTDATVELTKFRPERNQEDRCFLMHKNRIRQVTIKTIKKIAVPEWKLNRLKDVSATLISFEVCPLMMPVFVSSIISVSTSTSSISSSIFDVSN